MILQALCGRWRGSAFGGSSAVEEMKWWRWLGLKRPVPLLQAASDVVAKRSLLPPTWQASIFADFHFCRYGLLRWSGRVRASNN